MDPRKIRCENVDWIRLAQGRDQWLALVNTVMNLPVSLKWWKFLEWLSNYWLFNKVSVPWNQFCS
jgi:hypothetical protein